MVYLSGKRLGPRYKSLDCRLSRGLCRPSINSLIIVLTETNSLAPRVFPGSAGPGGSASNIVRGGASWFGIPRQSLGTRGKIPSQAFRHWDLKFICDLRFGIFFSGFAGLGVSFSTEESDVTQNPPAVGRLDADGVMVVPLLWA